MTKLLMNQESAYLGRGYVETHTGLFHFDNPEFALDDIAHALGMLVRFNGHCRFFYSVAEHSVLVAHIMKDLDLGDPFEGLMHDASEAYLSDVPAPFKQFFPDWQAYDSRMEAAIRDQFRLPSVKTAGCKEADWIACFIEARELMRSHGDNFADPHLLRPVALRFAHKYRIYGWSPEKGTSQFMAAYDKFSP